MPGESFDTAFFFTKKPVRASVTKREHATEMRGCMPCGNDLK
jgi:hypothetical protein